MHPSRAYAMTITGLGRILEDEARSLGFLPLGRANDGRADVVALGRFDARRAAGLRTAENVLLHLADVPLRASAVMTAGQLHADAVKRQLKAANVWPHRVRLVVRLRDERRFTRSALRAAIGGRLGGLAVPGDQPAAELWAVQSNGGRLWIGLRHPEFGTRSYLRRAVELRGSLPPAVAAAMLRLLDQPGCILDPCCGSGTIPMEAAAVGIPVIGGDLDPQAVRATRLNATAPVLRLDARVLPFVSHRFAGVVTNLPFGRKHLVQGAPVAWYRRVLQETVRVAPIAVILAAPTEPFRQALGRLPIAVSDHHRLEIKGNRTEIWVLERPRA